MNSIQYITQRVEGALHPADLEGVIPKENTSQSTPLRTQAIPEKQGLAIKNQEESLVSRLIQLILYVPDLLIFRPLSYIWYVITFPLTLLERRRVSEHQDSDTTISTSTTEDDDNNTKVEGQRPSFERSSSQTILEIDEDEKLEASQRDDANDTDLKSPTSPSTQGILSHNSKLFTFPRTVYPVNLATTGFKKTLILDLDETLVHSVSRGKRLASSSYQVEIKLKDQVATLYYVQKRPYCDMFLKQVSKWFNLIIFTASVKEYADPVIDLLETEKKYFSQRYYRDHCTLREGQGYIKDLTTVDRNLNHVIIVDNSPISYALHENNAVSVEGWISDSTDTDLLNLIPVLYSLRYTTDVRTILSLKNGEAAFER
ncbi:CYFA0S12e02784g1_1 [Cyberlindnera fabianii]|uniref:CYFA0S12e02784g1_1 n=1 Tax=Cyberlindnera fabianii TaxID=36022 RepID=A0A061B6Y8_CYBFA|nr:Nuclear envelope morphology protein 1 [Cyberlindnera fabianii]CDR43638.1 CYFA0S12e02784g1_1 [Cyberlindnera fabianii]